MFSPGGGFNTVARALLSIAEEYQDTDDWDDIYNKVCDKVVIQGHSQDTTWDTYIADLYPDLKTISSSGRIGAGYGYLYFKSQDAIAEIMDNYEYYGGSWLTENIKFNHGELMANYHLVGDGTYYEGEGDEYQFGLSTTVKGKEFSQYDWLGEGDSGAWIVLIPVGLRGLNDGGLEDGYYSSWGGRLSVKRITEEGTDAYNEYNYKTGEMDTSIAGERWFEALSQDWAARANWTVNTYDECNHAPEVSAENLDIIAAPGEVVSLNGIVSDPDGDSLNIKWWVYQDAEKYSGNMDGLRVWDENKAETKFTVPTDAVEGDYFNLILEVSDDSDTPMTRYAQVIVTVEGEDEDENGLGFTFDVDFGVEPTKAPNLDYDKYTVINYTIAGLGADVAVTVSAKEDNSEFEIACILFGDDQDCVMSYDGENYTVLYDSGFMSGDAPLMFQQALDEDFWVEIN